MLRLLAVIAATLLFASPAAAQSCPETEVDQLWNELADVLEAAGSAADPGAQQAFEDRMIDSTIEAVDFELRAMFDMVDIGHVKTAEVIGEAVFAELEHLREQVGMSDEDWATIEALFTRTFDKRNLADARGTRERAAALMTEIERHARGEPKLGENFWE